MDLLAKIKIYGTLINARDEIKAAYEDHVREAQFNGMPEEYIEGLHEEARHVLGELQKRIEAVQPFKKTEVN